MCIWLTFYKNLNQSLEEKKDMFFDETKVSLKAGKGGDGCMSFLRQKYMPKGGPNGGNGGKEAIPQESLASTLDSVEGSSSGHDS